MAENIEAQIKEDKIQEFTKEFEIFKFGALQKLSRKELIKLSEETLPKIKKANEKLKPLYDVNFNKINR